MLYIHSQLSVCVCVCVCACVRVCVCVNKYLVFVLGGSCHLCDHLFAEEGVGSLTSCFWLVFVALSFRVGLLYRFV